MACRFSTGSRSPAMLPPSQPMRPAKRSPAAAATRWASATTGAPGSTPARFMATLTSTTTRIRVPASRAARSSASTCAGSSTATTTSAWRTRPARRASFEAPTTWLAMRMSRIPAAAMTSASPSFAQVTPCAPAWRSLCASAGVLMPLVCGRQPTPASPMMTWRIRATLRSKASRSTRRTGVSSSAMGRPIKAVWALMGGYILSSVDETEEARRSVAQHEGPGPRVRDPVAEPL